MYVFVCLLIHTVLLLVDIPLLTHVCMYVCMYVYDMETCLVQSHKMALKATADWQDEAMCVDLGGDCVPVYVCMYVCMYV